MKNEQQKSNSDQPDVSSGAVKLRIAWNRGKRKPVADEHGELWCDCKYPKLTSTIGRGQALCLLCMAPWYH